jgi:acetyltransferase
MSCEFHMKIVRVTADQATKWLPELIGLLQNTVSSGASIGFLPPLADADAAAYWQEVIIALHGPHRVLLVAQIDGAVAGSVQLDLASRPNGSHRAEVIKLMVHTLYRQKGIGRSLMIALEEEARNAGRSTLVLDTRQGDPSEKLYLRLGYQRVGVIPEYARSADGSLHTTVFFFKLLK